MLTASTGGDVIASGEKSFEEFTVSLVQSTMDALVSSAISQMRAYADLVSTLERGLTAFRAQANPADGSAILAWIKTYLPDLTLDATNKIVIAASGKWSSDSVDALIALFGRVDQIVGATLKLGNSGLTTDAAVGPALVGTAIAASQLSAGPDPVTTANAMLPMNAQSVAALKSGGQATILDAINTLLSNDAEQAFDQLNTLVKAGLYRIVVTDGHILTRAVFTLNATDQAQQNTASISVSNFQGAARASYGGARFGASLSAGYSRLGISVATSASSSTTTVTENIMGEVLVNFKGDYFPAITVQAAP